MRIYMKKMKIAVLVSGGVDSSVALRLLKDQGHDVTAFYLKIWLEDELSFLGECPWQEDLSYVRQVCKQLAVPLEVISLQKEYHDTVVAYTIAEVKAGRTPNPDILCNQRIKFGFFLNKIDTSFEKVATGHYAQVAEHEDGTVELICAPDPVKDQTYFLSHLSQQQLKRVLFPIGHLTKNQVREYAHQFKLPNKDRKDSQGICFLGKLKFRDFIKCYLGEKQGSLIELESNKQIAKHDGFWFYTIGQRQGLGLAGGPWYVVDKDPEHNIVYISRNYYSPDKKRDRFTITDCNWINGVPIMRPVQVKMRHGSQLYNCTVDLKNQQDAIIALAERDQGIALGQFAVLYHDKRCLGGGVITSVHE
jgi:tRNA-5-taurinomethyluridine 2-sulfurtransferase